MIRVSRGSLRSREIISPVGKDIRPTSNMVKQALFNMLAARVPGAKVLDMFGGTGQMGIEALSCGAASVTFCDNSPAAAELIKKNLNRLGLDAEVIRASYEDAAARLGASGRRFDIIIADPPYAGGFYDGVQSAVKDHRLLAEGGVLVLEYDKLLPPDTAAGYNVLTERGYGKRCLRILTAEDEQ